MPHYDHHVIEEELKAIFEKRFNITRERWTDEIKTMHLSGKEFIFAGRDYLYLLDDVEKKFGITIPERVIVNGLFSTFAQIAATVASMIIHDESNRIEPVVNNTPQ